MLVLIPPPYIPHLLIFVVSVIACICIVSISIDTVRLLVLICNDLLQRDLGIKPIISNFVELLPKFGYFFLLIIVHKFSFVCVAFVVGFVRVIVK